MSRLSCPASQVNYVRQKHNLSKRWGSGDTRSRSMWLKQISPTSLNHAALPQYVCLKKQVGESLLFICSRALHSTPLGHDVATINALSPSRWSKPHHGMFYWSIKLTPPFHRCHVPYHQALHTADRHINMLLVKVAVRSNSVHLFLRHYHCAKTHCCLENVLALNTIPYLPIDRLYVPF